MRSSLYQATIAAGDTTEDVELPAAVVLAESFLLVDVLGSQDNGDDRSVQASFLDSDTVRLQRDGTSGALTVKLTVVEWTGATVQEVDVLVNDTSNTGAVTAVDLGRTFVVGSWRCNSGEFGRAPFAGRLSLDDGTTVRVERASSDGALNATVFVVQLPAGGSVQSGVTPADTETDDVTIDEVVLDETFVVATWETARSTADGQVTARLADATTLRIERGSDTTTAGAAVAWFVVSQPGISVSHHSPALAAAATTADTAVASASQAFVLAMARTADTTVGWDDSDPAGWLSSTANARVQRSGSDGALNVELQVVRVNAPPNAPALTYPTDGLTVDRTSTVRFSWDFSDPDAGDSQSEHHLEIRPQGSIVNTVDVVVETTNEFHDVAPGTLAADDYEWRARYRDAQGEQGPFSGWEPFTAADPPAGPSITSPTDGATISEQFQTVTWSAAEQDAYQLRVLGDDAGVPDETNILFDTGEVPAAVARALLVEYDFNGLSVHTDVRSQRDGLWSERDSVRNPVSFTVPAIPTVAKAVLQVSIDGVLRDAAYAISATHPTPSPGNLLTENQASLETDTDGWVTLSGCTIARSTAEAAHGAASLALTATAAGNMAAATDRGLSGVPVVAGTTYTALASFLDSGVARNVRCYLTWFDAAGSAISDDAPAYTTQTLGVWTAVFVTAVAPVGAAFASVQVQVDGVADTEVQYVDEVSLAAGTSTVWAMPSPPPEVTSMDVERSVADAGVWMRVAAGIGPTETFLDYVPFGKDFDYRVKAIGDNGTSVYSTDVPEEPEEPGEPGDSTLPATLPFLVGA